MNDIELPADCNSNVRKRIYEVGQENDTQKMCGLYNDIAEFYDQVGTEYYPKSLYI